MTRAKRPAELYEPARRLRTWMLRLLAVGFGLLGALLVAELAVRARDLAYGKSNTGSEFEGSVYEFCRSRHHRLIPNGRYQHSSYEFNYTWANNSLGMRDRERAREKAPGTFRIFFLGDSFIQGHGVRLEDAMVTRLEASLNQPQQPHPVEVLNGGVFGYGPMLEYLYLHEVIDSIQPDLVMVGFFLGNDVGDDYFYSQKAHVSADGDTVRFDDREWPWSRILDVLNGGVNPNQGEPQRAEPQASAGHVAAESGGLRELIYPLRQRSRALTLLKNSIDTFKFPERREREFALVRAHRDDIRYELALVDYPVLSRDQRMAYWAVSQKYLEKIAALCRAHGARLILVVIPQVERLTGETDFNEPYEVLDQLGAALSVPVINLLPDFTGKDPYALYYKLDRHWTAEGHRVAAHVLDRELRRRQVLPGLS